MKPTSASFPLTLKWQKDLGNSTYDRPTYQNGLLFFPASKSLTSYWYRLDPDDGREIWSQFIARYSYQRCLTSKHLVVSGSHSLKVLDPVDGRVISEKGPGVTATCSEDIVFFIGNRQFVQAANLMTGEFLWQGTKPQEPFSGLIYNQERNELIANDKVIVAPPSGLLTRLFESSPLIHVPTDQGRGPMYLIDQGQLFIGGSVRDAGTGEILHIEDRFYGFAAPTVTNDTIFIADGGGYPYPAGVASRDRTNYTVKWVYQPEHKLRFLGLVTLSPVAIFDGVGYVIFSDATLRAVDLETGQEIGHWQPKGFDLMLWPGCTLPIPRLPNPFDCVHSSGVGMTTSEDTLFVSFGDGKLYAFGK